MFIGIDLGTTELKVVLLDSSQELVASQSVALAISRPHPLWSEQDPNDWWGALDHAMRALRAQVADGMAQVRAIGLAGQMHGAVLLGRNHEVLRPAILWNDGRSARQCQELEATVPDARHITGNRAMPGFTAPKLLWVRRHEPLVFEQVSCVLLPKDFLRWHLCGALATDCSDASGTLWLDVGARSWSAKMLAACGMDVAQMPGLVEGSSVSGELLPALAASWGLPKGVVVAGGAGDNAASAVGVGAINPGEGFVSLGTSGVIFLVSDGYRPNAESAMHAFCHALPRRWHQMSVMLSAASCLRWASRLTGLSEAELVGLAARLTSSEKEHAPLFLPYLSGERTPHNDPYAQGVLHGMTHDHDAAHLAYSVLEGVSFGMLDGFQTLASTRSAERPLELVGGGAKSIVWAGLLATVLDVPLAVTPGNEAGAAIGAARLGALASGATLGEVFERSARDAQIFTPRVSEKDHLLARHKRFTNLYATLKGSFSRT